MDVLKQIAHLEALKNKAQADGKVGMALYYEEQLDQLKTDRKALVYVA